MKKPIGMGAVDTGPGSVEYERRLFEGTWTLERFEAMNAAGQPQPVKAEGTLTYDAYGNIKVAGKLLEAMPNQQLKDLQPMLQYEGRVTIDPARKEFRLRDADAAVPADASLSKVIGKEMVRKYEITKDRLTLTFVSPEGRTVGRAFFRRGV